MEIRTDGLRILLEDSFGLKLGDQKLISDPSSCTKDVSHGSSIEIVDETLKERAGRRLLAEEINKQKNLEDVVLRADAILQKNLSFNESKGQSIGKTDRGWVDDCLDGAGKAYDESLKEYWAKLLAGEIIRPGFYSRRAIQFMKTLSKNDAERIRKMCQYVIYDSANNNPIILRCENSKYTFDEISFLMELRLLDNNHLLVRNYRFYNNNGFAFFRKREVGLFIKINRNDYKLPIYSFTELGKEILTIIDDVDINREFLKEFSNSITKTNNFLVVTCGDLIESDRHYQLKTNSNFFEISGKGVETIQHPRTDEK